MFFSRGVVYLMRWCPMMVTRWIIFGWWWIVIEGSFKDFFGQCQCCICWTEQENIAWISELSMSMLLSYSLVFSCDPVVPVFIDSCTKMFIWLISSSAKLASSIMSGWYFGASPKSFWKLYLFSSSSLNLLFFSFCTGSIPCFHRLLDPTIVLHL